VGLFDWLRRLVAINGRRPRPNGYPSVTGAGTDLWTCWHRLVPMREQDLYSPTQLLRSPRQVPAAPGIYAWYFDALPRIPTANCYSVGRWRLMYIGTAPRNEDSSGNLRKRICKQHLGKSVSASTLRFSLAFLLQKELDLEITRRKQGDKSWWLGAAGEQSLTDWMCDHALVAWSAAPQPWEHEGRMVGVLGGALPLNIRGNTSNPLALRLKRDRTRWRKRCLGIE